MPHRRPGALRDPGRPAGAPYLDSDIVFGVKTSLVEDFVPTEDGTLACVHDFVLPASGHTGEG